MNIADIWKYDLRRGKTDHPRNGACLFDAGMWLVYGRIGDDPPCSCPVIRPYATGLNDMLSDDLRTVLLKPFILRVVGNRDPEAELARLHTIILETARRIVPLAALTQPQFVALRKLTNYASFETLGAAANYAFNNASTYAAAHTAMSLYKAAMAAGYRNNFYVGLNAAHAARTAADAGIQRSIKGHRPKLAWPRACEVWTTATEVLDAALRIGRQSPEFDEAQVRESAKAFGIAAGLEVA